ncbi:MAG TPA: hypothetical protein VF103_12920 [Polyangiaceae bacterium]
MQKPGLLALACVFCACSNAPADGSEGTAPSASVMAPNRLPWVPPTPGPVLGVFAGQGVGVIRIGANVAMVERLMEAPCEVKADNFCRYVTRGVDFHFVGGILQWVYVQRRGRPAGKSADGTNDLTFGFFKGLIPPDLRLGMRPEAIREYLGKPERVEKAPEPNPQNTVWLHHYPGMTLEYDRWENGNLILGGIRIFKDPNAAPAGAPNAGADAGAGGAASASAVSAGAPLDAGVPRDGAKRSVDAGPVREPEPR